MIQRLFSLILASIFFVAPLFIVNAQSGDEPPPETPPESGGAGEPTPPETPPQNEPPPAEVPPAEESGAEPEVAAPVEQATSTPASPVESTPRAVGATSTLPSPSPTPTPTPDSPTSDITDVDPNPTPTSEDVSESTTTPPESNNTLLILAAIAGVLALAGLGFAKGSFQNKNAKNNTNDDGCGKIKAALEQKKTELELTIGGLSLQQALLDALEKKVTGKGEQLIGKFEGKIEAEVKNKIFELDKSGTVKETVKFAEELKGTYEEIKEKIEKTKKLIERIKAKEVGITAELQALESSYKTCTAGTLGMKAVIDIGKNIKIPDFNAKKKTLFVEKEVIINATYEKVWQALTDPSFTKEWVKEFGMDGNIESGWNKGDSVLWKKADGKAVVKGEVTEVVPNSLLHFTVIDVEHGPIPGMDESDGITYKLSPAEGGTTLHITQGDFAKDKDGEKYYNMTVSVWEKVLQKVKELAEKQ